MAYEILWKDQTYRINKNEKWTKISRSKLIAYLKAKYPDPAEREMKELELALGHEVETNTFKCRNAERVSRTGAQTLLDAEILRDFLTWETSFEVYPDTWKIPAGPQWTKTNEQITVFDENGWPPVGFMHLDWKLENVFLREDGSVFCARWARTQGNKNGLFITSSPDSRPTA